MDKIWEEHFHLKTNEEWLYMILLGQFCLLNSWDLEDFLIQHLRGKTKKEKEIKEVEITVAPKFYELGQAYSHTEICSETYPAVINFFGLFKIKF